MRYQEYVLTKSHLSRIEMRTVMVYGIPVSLRHEAALKSYFNSLNIGRVESVVVCRQFAKLKRVFYSLHSS